LNKAEQILGKFGKFISFIAILLIVFLSYLYFFKPELLNINNYFRKFPSLENPKQVALTCNYKGNTLTIGETLYKSVDGYYASDPKKRDITSKDEYQSFVFSYPEDNVIKKLADDIKLKGKEKNLSGDQTLDLANCFVQSIPYDQEKAQKVLSTSGNYVTSNEFQEIAGRFPYETLYDNQGICTDKSYLTSAIIKELGYGSSLFLFDKERHMAVGVKVPFGYSSFDSGYSYIETTNIGYKVGQLPNIDTENGLAKKLEIDFSNNDYKVPNTYKDLGKFKILPEIQQGNISNPSKTIKVSDGMDYERIIQIAKTEDRIKELIDIINSKNGEIVVSQKAIEKQKQELTQMSNEVASYETEVKQAENLYKSSPTLSNYNSYNTVYAKYKRKYNQYSSLINQYNKAANNYNALIEEINKYISEYNNLINQ